MLVVRSPGVASLCEDPARMVRSGVTNPHSTHSLWDSTCHMWRQIIFYKKKTPPRYIRYKLPTKFNKYMNLIMNGSQKFNATFWHQLFFHSSEPSQQHPLERLIFGSLPPHLESLRCLPRQLLDVYVMASKGQRKLASSIAITHIASM